MAYNNWYATNPNPMPEMNTVNTSSFRSFVGSARDYTRSANRHMQGEAHMWARKQFAGSFAEGGWAASAFAPNTRQAMAAPFRRKHKVGSKPYMDNLRKLQSLHPENKSIAKAIKNAKLSKGGGLGAMAGGALSAAFIIGAAATEEGGIEEKARGLTKGIAGEVGSRIGTKVGASLGAGIGSAFGPLGTAVGWGVGYLAGGMIGWTVGGGLADAATRIPDKMVAAERERRAFGWGAHTEAFRTGRASTMRQQSLALMNRGAMSSRSLLGQEAVYIHK